MSTIDSIKSGHILADKLATQFSGEDDRRAARSLLAPVLEGHEGERVALGCLKLADGDLTRLGRCVKGALEDYRDILAWAESPRQMRQGANAPAAEQARARWEDAEEYARWIWSCSRGGVVT